MVPEHHGVARPVTYQEPRPVLSPSEPGTAAHLQIIHPFALTQPRPRQTWSDQPAGPVRWATGPHSETPLSPPPP